MTSTVQSVDETSDGQTRADTQRRRAVGPTSGSQSTLDTQDRHAAGSTSTTSGGQPDTDTQGPCAAGPTSTEGQYRADTHGASALGPSSTDSQSDHDDHGSVAVCGPILADPVLGILADVVDDLEAVRVANENRLRTLTDDSERGHGLTLDNPEVARLALLVDSIAAAEHQAVLNLQRSMRRHPLWVWAKPIAGIGQKQLARLLAVIGDPYWNDLHDRPRTVSELWAFCGYHVITSGGQAANDSQAVCAAGSSHTSTQTRHDNQSRFGAGVAPKRQKGQQSNWNENARKRCYLIAESCIKQAKSPYRKVYDDTRAHYADSVHNEPCVRCGPKGKPAPTGSPLSLGHQNMRGIRKVAKEVLRDLWREAKRIHELQSEELS